MAEQLGGRLLDASGADLRLIGELDRLCFDPGWDTATWRSELESDNSAVVLCQSGPGPCVGYYCVSWVLEIAELRRMAVVPAARGRGLGGDLLRHALAELAGRSIEKLWLEVRASNSAARALYEGAGFRVDRIRRGYYRDPLEDGVDMSLDLRGLAGG